MVFITQYNIILSVNIVDIDDGLLNICPYKNGDIIIINNISYKIIIKNKNKDNNKLFNKLKHFIPIKWHSIIDFELLNRSV